MNAVPGRPGGWAPASALLLLAAFSGGGESQGCITGRVLGPDGLPVRGAHVEAQAESAHRAWPTLARAETDATGRYRVGPLPALPSVLSLRVSAEGLATARRPAFRGAFLSFRLGRAGGIRGRVRWERTGLPVPGFRVGVHGGPGERGERVVTGPDGAYEVRGIPPGHYGVQGVTWWGAPAVATGVLVEAGETTTRDLWLPDGVTVFGRVTGPGGRPLPGAVVRSRFREAPADSAGSYRLSGFPPFTPDTMNEPETLVFEAPGMAPARETPVLSPGVGEFRLDVSLAPAIPEEGRRGIRGGVFFRGKPVPGARIHLSPGDAFRRGTGEAAISDAAGSFLVAGHLTSRSIRTGPFRLFASTDDGFLGVSHPVPEPFRPGEAISIAMQPSAEIRGTIRTGTGRPVAGHRVAVRMDGDWSPPRAERHLGETATDEEGRYLFRVPAGTAAILREGSGRTGRERPIERVEAGEIRRNVDLVAEADPAEKGTLSGVVVDEAGEPIRGVEVSDWVCSVLSDASGAFALEGTGAEIQVVMFTHSAFANESRFHVKTSGPPLMVVMRRGLEIRGRVEPEPGGWPVRSFRIVLARNDTDHPRSVAEPQNDAGGRFHLRSLDPGTYDLRVEAGWRHSAWIRGVEVAPGRPSPDLAVRLLPGARITGTVKDDAGVPCRNEEVWGVGPLTEEEGDFRPVATTDSAGTFVWACLEAGQYRIRIKGDPDFEEASRVVEVAAGGSAVADLVRVRTPR